MTKFCGKVKIISDLEDINIYPNSTGGSIWRKSHIKKSKILEVGCGEGQNAIYLARQGHLVDAFDLSQYGIAKLEHRCKLSNTQVNTFVADLTTYQFKQNYDMIICFGTLHFVAKDDWKKFINNAKKYTNIGGIHIIQIFTDTIPASEDIAPFAVD